MIARPTRRSIVLAMAFAAPAALSACRRSSDDAARCARCGMKITDGNLMAAELRTGDGQTLRYDALRCALAARLDGRSAATLRVHEYYDGRIREADDSIVFALGSDVTGPMGSDLVPVAKAQMSKFAADHGAKRFVLLSEIDSAILAQIP